jgi:hypothetical protein
MPNANPGANGFPTIQMLDGKIPAAIGLPNDTVQNVLAAERSGNTGSLRVDPFQAEWLNACKGTSNGVTHGTSSKTHCDFDYSGTMIEQMLLGLVAHRAGKRLEYDGATGRITNVSEANEWLKRTYRPNWTLNG